MPPFLILEGIAKSFGDQSVLERVSLDIEEGEILVLLGPSGSGKTTLLRLIAGFEAPDAGSLRVGGEDVTGLAPEQRNFGMVFQHYALFPHLSVGENVAFGLESRGVSREGAELRVREVLPQVDLEGFENRRIHQISGGQQQRVALARALAPRPRVLLLDEPLSNLDPALRQRTRQQLRETVRRIGITAVWVTHEQDEAFDVGDRVAILNEGHLEQVGTAEQLYLEPDTPFVAGFVGQASTLRAVVGEGGELHLARSDNRGDVWILEGSPFRGLERLGVGTAVEIVMRPEGLSLVAPDQSGALEGQIVERRYAGEITYYGVELEGGARVLVSGSVGSGRVGDRVGVVLRPEGPLPRLFAVGGSLHS